MHAVEVVEEAEALQRGGLVRRLADGGQRHRNALVVQDFDETRDVFLRRHFVRVELLDDGGQSLADGLFGEFEVERLLEVSNALIDGHGPHGLIELLFLSFREFDALRLQEVCIEVLPDGHGVDERAVDVEDGGFVLLVLDVLEEGFQTMDVRYVFSHCCFVLI